MPTATMQPTTNSRPWLPYTLPMGVYMAFLLAQSHAPLIWIYPAKTIAVAATLWFFRKQYEELCSPMWCSGATGAAPALQSWLIAILVGLVAIIIWIGIDPYYPKFGNAA